MAQFVPEPLPKFDQSLLSYLNKSFSKLREVIAELNRNNSYKPVAHEIAAAEATISGSYVDLTTPGPTVQLVTGPKAMVYMFSLIENNGADQGGVLNVEVKNSAGAVVFAPVASRDIEMLCSAAGRRTSGAGMIYFDALPTSGKNTFTAKYRVHWGGTATFSTRRMIVVPLP